MFNQAKHIREKYIRESMYPSIFCTGCGVGNVINYSMRALDALALDMDRVALVSGIGCSSRIPGYIRADALHTTHGRALAVATGIKTANPDLTVVVFTGDGDCAGIGGNHLIHAARRNVDLSVFCINNYTYGMTGGQVSPTTPQHGMSTTTPYGNVEEPFDLCRLVSGAGAAYVARWCVGYPYEIVDAMTKAIGKKGFGFVELLVPCPTGYGKHNRVEEGRESWTWYKQHTILKSRYAALSEEERRTNTKWILGDLQDLDRQEWTQRWADLVEAVQRDESDGPG